MASPVTKPGRIGLLGTGIVGETLGTRLVSVNYEVFMGSRDASNPRASAWAKKNGERANHGTFRQAAEFGEIVINATHGSASLDVLRSAGAENLNGKVLLDAANVLDLNTGIVALSSDTSLAEQIQQAYPHARVVKSLNSMNVSMMMGQHSHPGHHNVFMAGNDLDAKREVARLLEAIGWQRETIIDLGSIEAARGQEHYMALFWRLFQALGTLEFNIAVVKK
jgi:predicted dinucleotide-binding enzyme